MSTSTPKPPVQSKARSASSVTTPMEQVELVLADKALLSLRASGHDYCSAVGEVFDNSIQANANIIRLRLFTEKRVIAEYPVTEVAAEEKAEGGR